MYAQDEASAFTADLYGGLYLNNEPAWQLEPSVSWLFHKYLGVSLGLELTSQYNQPSRQTVIDGHEAELADNERNIGWLILKPSLVIKISCYLGRVRITTVVFGFRPSRGSVWRVRSETL